MKSVLNIPVSIFKNAESRIPRTVNLWDWLKDDSDRETLEQIRAEGNKVVREALKKSLSCCTISGQFSTRSESNLLQHSGLICLDIDVGKNTHLKNQMGRLKQLITTAPFVAFVGYSASGEGLYTIIPISRKDQHTEHFLALEKLFAKIGVTIDTACKDVTRLRFKAFDQQPYVNHQAKPFTARMAPEAKIITLSKSQDHAENLRWVEAAVSEIELRQIDLTGSYEKWLHLGFAFSSAFCEEGRDFFHRVSRFHEEYNPDAADNQYDRCLRSGKPGITLATFYHECKQAGILIRTILDFR